MSKNTSISLGNYFEQFIQSRISEGRYNNVSEVIRAGLRLLEEEESKVIALRKAIKEVASLQSKQMLLIGFNLYYSRHLHRPYLQLFYRHACLSFRQCNNYQQKNIKELAHQDLNSLDFRKVPRMEELSHLWDRHLGY